MVAEFTSHSFITISCHLNTFYYTKKQKEIRLYCIHELIFSYTKESKVKFSGGLLILDKLGIHVNF